MKKKIDFMNKGLLVLFFLNLKVCSEQICTFTDICQAICLIYSSAHFSGLVKFFGCVARLRPKEICTKNEAFVNTVFDNLTSPDSPSMHSLAIQTVGFIGTSVEGKLALEKLGKHPYFHDVVTCICSSLVSLT